MGIISSATGGVVSAILNSNVVNKLADLIPDPLAKQRAIEQFSVDIAQIVATSDVGQSQINTAEATSPNKFISYWRPFIGWICGFAFAWHFILMPMVLFAFTLSGKTVPLPSFDMQTLITVLFGMLGLGAMRTVEKIQGVA